MKTTTIITLALAAGLAAGCKKKDDKAEGTSKAGEGTGKAEGTAAGTVGGTAAGTASTPTTPAATAEVGLVGDGKEVAPATTTSKVGAVLLAAEIDKNEQAALKHATPAIPQNALALMGDTPIEDKGDFKMVVQPGDDSPIRQAVQQQLTTLVGELNKAIKLPRDINVVMKKCGEPNAFYNPYDHQIEFCDEFAPSAYQKFARYKTDEKEIQRMTMNTVTSVFIHELGHALIGEWKLPATGREEDAADQLSGFVLIGESDESAQIILDAAEFWLMNEIERGEMGRNMQWDTHSLDQQRFYSLACLVFGSKPNKYEFLLTDFDIPLKRAGWCEKEYRDMRAAWSALLEKILIQG